MKTLKQKAKDKCDNNRTVEEIEEIDYIAPRFFVMYQPIANLGPFLLILVQQATECINYEPRADN